MLCSECLLSIIIPVYNTKKKELKRCFDSCKSIINSKTKCEVIVIDDYSDYPTQEFCSNYCEKSSGFRYLRTNDRSGISSSRNMGIANAMGRYIYFLDSDDYIYSDRVDDILQELSNLKSDLFITNYIFKTKKQENPVYHNLPKGEINSEELVKLVKGVLKENYLGFIHGIFYKNQYLHEHNIRFIQGMVHGEDALFNLCCLTPNTKMYYMPLNFCCYFYDPFHAINRWKRNTSKMIEGAKIVFEAKLKTLEIFKIADLEFELKYKRIDDLFMEVIDMLTAKVDDDKLFDLISSQMVLLERPTGFSKIIKYECVSKKHKTLLKAYAALRKAYLIIKFG